MSWKKFTNADGIVEYSCASTDAKHVTDPHDAEGILEGSKLTETQPGGGLKIYGFYQGCWYEIEPVTEFYRTEADRQAYAAKITSGEIVVPIDRVLTFYICAEGQVTTIWKYSEPVGWVEL